MPLRNPKNDSHVMAAAAAQESTKEILNSVHPKVPPPANPLKPPDNSFIEDVELWVRKYLRLADEVLDSPPEPETDINKSAA